MAARVHVTDTYDFPDTDDADADTDDDAGPCEDIVVLAKTHSGASEDTYCGSGTLTMGHPWSPMVTHGKYESPMVRYGSPRVRYGPKWSKMVENMPYTIIYKKMFKNRILHKKYGEFDWRG